MGIFMFEQKRNVWYSEISSNKKTNLVTILNYFQDAAIEHSANAGFTLDNLSEQNRAWIMISMNVQVERYPSYGEEIKVYTWSTGFDRLYGYRSYEIKDKIGAQIAKGASLWVFVDTKKQKPVRITEDVAVKYKSEDRLVLDYVKKAPSLPEDSKEISRFKVRNMDIDTNNHVNNVKFVGYALEALPADATIYKAEVYYKHEARKGNIICTHLWKDENTALIKLTDPDDNRHITAKFTFK